MKANSAGRIAVWLAGAVMSGILAAGPAGAQTNVTMWTFLDPNKTSPREVALKQMIADFEAANPGIKVTVEPQDFAQMPAKFFSATAPAGTPTSSGSTPRTWRGWSDPVPARISTRS